MKVYVYTEYCDTCPYETEIIEVYANEYDAKARLKERVEKHYDQDWETLINGPFGWDEEMSDTIVRMWEGDDHLYWSVQEAIVIEK